MHDIIESNSPKRYLTFGGWGARIHSDELTRKAKFLGRSSTFFRSTGSDDCTSSVCLTGKRMRRAELKLFVRAGRADKVHVCCPSESCCGISPGAMAACSECFLSWVFFLKLLLTVFTG